jgi:hypothetical protein
LRDAIRDLEMALAFYEAARIPHMRADIQGRFAETEASHTFVALRSAALFQTTLTVMRLWDSNRDTAVLVMIAKDLRSDALLDWLASKAQREQSHLWGSAIGATTRADLVKQRDLIEDLTARRLCERLSRLRAYRDKRLAHRDPFEGPRTERARLAEVQDAVVVLGISCVVLRALRLSIDGSRHRPRDVRLLRRRSAEAFWRIPLRTERLVED